MAWFWAIHLSGDGAEQCVFRVVVWTVDLQPELDCQTFGASHTGCAASIGSKPDEVLIFHGNLVSKMRILTEHILEKGNLQLVKRQNKASIGVDVVSHRLRPCM